MGGDVAHHDGNIGNGNKQQNKNHLGNVPIALLLVSAHMMMMIRRELQFIKV